MDKAPTNDSNDTNAPVIFIVGSTGSGKTKLSLSLAQHNKDIEIVGADALQLYKTADIMTAKATAEEQATVKHHVIDILELECLDFGRKDYFEIASKKIKELHEDKKVPLVVGGTNYYIESLLYTDFDMIGTHEIDDPEIDDLYAQVRKKVKGDPESMEESKTVDVEVDKKEFEGWEQLPLSEKHALLTKVDPLIAEKVHPNDAKRVENYIKVYLEEGVVPSKKIMRVNSQRKLRYCNPVIFWVKDKEKENLAERIKKRIYEMVSMDGIREIVQIYEYLESKGPFEFQRGVLQSIGYKEFYEFYKRVKDVMKEKGIDSVTDFLVDKASKEDFDEETKEVLARCIKQLIGATDQYAKKQIRWIKNRIASEPLLTGKFFKLEFSESAKFEEEVVKKAVDIMKDCMEGRLENGREDEGREENEDQDQIKIKYENWKRYFCETCDVTASGQEQWTVHIKSKKHKKMKEGEARHKKNMEMKNKHEQKKAQENKEEVQE